MKKALLALFLTLIPASSFAVIDPTQSDDFITKFFLWVENTEIYKFLDEHKEIEFYGNTLVIENYSSGYINGRVTRKIDEHSKVRFQFCVKSPSSTSEIRFYLFGFRLGLDLVY